jgi:hypothetical protein
MYFSDKYLKIPNGIIAKGATGVGLTSYALENNVPTVVVTPTVAMIKNKVSQYPNSRRPDSIIGIYQGVSLNTVKDYIENIEIPKIMVTFDSFYKVVPLIDDSYQIIVDEFSELLDAYNYRNKAISKLLIEVQKFSKVSYVSATPTKIEYLPPQLKELPYTTLVWEDLTKISIDLLHKKRPIQTVRALINKYRSGLVEINGIKSDAGYFFVNSVRMIKEICEKAELLNSEVRIICSDTDKNRRTLGDYDISTSLDPETLFTFITSCSFKGLDFYSERGVVFVVSNNTNTHTLITIDTDIIQIAGRIRNPTNPFRNYLCHIFNVNPLSLTREEFVRVTEEKIKQSNILLQGYSKLTSEERALFLSTQNLENFYISVDEEGNPYYDEMLYLLDKRRYEDIAQVYKDGLSVNSYYSSLDSIGILPSTKLDIDYLVDNSFYSLCKTAVEGRGNIGNIYEQFPLIKEAIEKLGVDKVKALTYNPTRIQHEIDDFDKKDKIKTTVSTQIEKGKFYSCKDMKIALGFIYTRLGVRGTAKASDITEYCEARLCCKKINDKSVKGYQIL